ncbi:hypothetical protein QVD17_18839 [Tagetes erecta]|uniref:Uncharacterized protein n=1 Tax=Tagetes erecta TaxID=13708 RepID=A0AAD8KPW5_TARER|nr:hypothetical protein QVD17_18839 [Tagetes erecta]
MASMSRHATRSVSLPTRSHPSTLQLEGELVKFKTWETSVLCISDAKTVYNGVTNLDRLYTCVDDLLSLPLTRQALSCYRYEKVVHELDDRSMRVLEICGFVRDIVSQVKEHVRNVQSALRRGKGDLIMDYSFLKKLIKDAKKGVADYKQIDHVYGTKALNVDDHLSSVIRVLRGASDVSVLVFGMILSYVSMLYSKRKYATKWSIVSKFMHKGAAGCKDQPHICVEALDCSIENIENSLECLFKRLIRTRASLLNIMSY